MVCYLGPLKPGSDAVLYFLSRLVLTWCRCQVYTYYISLWELVGHLYRPWRVSEIGKNVYFSLKLTKRQYHNLISCER